MQERTSLEDSLTGIGKVERELDLPAVRAELARAKDELARRRAQPRCSG